MGPVRCKNMVERSHYPSGEKKECKCIMNLRVVYEGRAYFQCPQCGFVRSVRQELLER